MGQHEEFVAHGMLIFSGSTIDSTDTFEQARDRLFGLLREENKYLEPVARWRSACRVTYALIKGRSEPHRGWAKRILDEDLTQMLSALHKGGYARDYTTAWPDQWEPDPDLAPF